MVRRASTPRRAEKDTAPDRTQAAPEAEEQRARALDMDPESGGGPNEDDIRVRAYHRYLERGGGDGQAFEDWLEAERELKMTKSER